MKSFKVTYSNGRTENTIIVKARSIESARIEEEKALAMFRRINPAISLVNVEVA